ncbi:ATP-binding protein [Alkalinema pantanalense CENA528]|uniref:sensor histidine kinase n=1 Tax=Alkalinema pantanalense TaxID=1620705 RepID=UPI003D6E97BA
MEATIDVLKDQVFYLQDELQAKETLLNLCLDSLPEAVQFMSLQDGQILYVNQTWQEQLGYSLLEAQQLFWHDLIVPNADSENSDRALDLFCQKFGHLEESIEIWLQTKYLTPIKMRAEMHRHILNQSTGQGSILLLKLRPVNEMTPQPEPRSAKFSHPSIFSQFTHPGSIERPYTTQVCYSDPAFSELCTYFVTRASHELRTPLAVIASSASILSNFGDQIDASKKNHHLQCIQTYVQHTTQILDEILLLYKVDTGYLEFRPITCDCLELIQGMVGELQVQSPDRLIEMSAVMHSSQGSEPQAVNPLHPRSSGCNSLIDRTLFRQIMTNLLSNASKYSHPESVIKITVTLGETNLRIAIEDQGMGIVPEDLPQICQLFHRGQNVGTIPGTGLGLCIVEKCVALHGGQLEVESRLNQGSIFTVTLPR